MNGKKNNILITDEAIKRLNCPFENCSTKLNDKESLIEHLKSHDCGKAFNSQINLKTHYRKHFKKENFICQYENCNLEFTKVSKLAMHHRIHVGYKPYKCDKCSKCFIEKSFLETHLRIHTGELPFKCKICNAGFKSKDEIMDHEINSHDIKKPFACKNCKSRFSKLSSLKVHDKIHSGKRPFACPFPECGKSFVEKGNMKTHFKTHENFDTYLELIDDDILKKRNNDEDDETSNVIVNIIDTKLNTNNISSKENDIKQEDPLIPILSSTNILEISNLPNSPLHNNFLKFQKKVGDYETYIDDFNKKLEEINLFYDKLYEMNSIFESFQNETSDENEKSSVIKMKEKIANKITSSLFFANQTLNTLSIITLTNLGNGVSYNSNINTSFINNDNTNNNISNYSTAQNFQNYQNYYNCQNKLSYLTPQNDRNVPSMLSIPSYQNNLNNPNNHNMNGFVDLSAYFNTN